MEKNQQILLTICVKPNLMIDKEYFIGIAGVDTNSYEVFKKRKRNKIPS